MNDCFLRSLAHLPPDAKLTRIELGHNQLKGEDLKNLVKYSDTLRTLKLAKNELKTKEDLAALADLKFLRNLDLEKNEVCKLSDYKQHMFQLCPTLQVLDNQNRAGELVLSEDEDDFDGAEGGEDEFEEMQLMNPLNEDQMEELRMRGISVKDYMAAMQGDFEGGEDDLDDEFNGDEKNAEGKDKVEGEDAGKRQRTEWCWLIKARSLFHTSTNN